MLPDAQIETATNAVRIETRIENRDDAVTESRAVERLEDEQRDDLRAHPAPISILDILRRMTSGSETDGLTISS